MREPLNDQAFWNYNRLVSMLASIIAGFICISGIYTNWLYMNILKERDFWYVLCLIMDLFMPILVIAPPLLTLRIQNTESHQGNKIIMLVLFITFLSVSFLRHLSIMIRYNAFGFSMKYIKHFLFEIFFGGFAYLFSVFNGKNPFGG